MTAMLPRPSSDLPDDENLFGPVVRLSTLATELAELPLGPRPNFRAELRARLLDEARPATAAGVLDPPVRRAVERPRRGRYGRRAAAMGLALALTGGGVAAAAGKALPGEPLYPVKRFGQSVRLALDPGSGVGPSLRLVSARISDVERTAAIDPAGADASRWNALDSAVADADSRLVRLTASSSAQQLSAALAPDRARLVRVLPAVPAAHRSALQQLRDTIDGLAAAQPVAGGAALPVDLLPAGGLAPSGPLAAGWPLDPASLRLPTPVVPRPQLGRTGGSSTGATGSGSGSSTSTGSRPGSSSSSGRGTASSGGATQLPTAGLPGSGTRTSTSGQVLPRTTSGLGTAVDRTIGGTLGRLGGTGSTTSSGSTGTPSGGSRTGTVGNTVTGVVGDATDTVSHLPLINGLTGSTTTR